MFGSKKKITFTKNGVWIPEIGRVYYGKEVTVPSKLADKLINNGYAELVVEKAFDLAVECEDTTEVENVRISKPRKSKRTFKSKR